MPRREGFLVLRRLGPLSSRHDGRSNSLGLRHARGQSQGCADSLVGESAHSDIFIESEPPSPIFFSGGGYDRTRAARLTVSRRTSGRLSLGDRDHLAGGIASLGASPGAAAPPGAAGAGAGAGAGASAAGLVSSPQPTRTEGPASTANRSARRVRSLEVMMVPQRVRNDSPQP